MAQIGDVTAQNFLAEINGRIAAQLGWKLFCGAEIECYLSADAPEWEQRVQRECAAKNIPLLRIERERGNNQFELITPAQPPFDCAQTIEQLRGVTQSSAEELGVSVNFLALPNEAQPASGMHFHLHAEDDRGHKLYTKHDSLLSPALAFSIAGMLALMPETMLAFADTKPAYARYSLGTALQTPRTISWGGNNRTLALRLPDTASDEKRIEHRVSAADADPFLALSAILCGIHYGASTQLPLTIPPCFGNAFLPEYGLEKLPASWEEAREAFGNAVITPLHYPELQALLQGNE